jgi:hypothetical protein
MSEALAILSISAGILLALLVYAGIAFAWSRLTREEIEALPPSLLQSMLDGQEAYWRESEERWLETKRKIEALKILPCAPIECPCKGSCQGQISQ